MKQDNTQDRDGVLLTSLSGRKIKPVYTRADVKRGTGSEMPGQPSFTRGVHEQMYRKRLWTMRQFAGFGTAEQTNERFRFLLSQGQTGLSVAFDLPTLMGLDSDAPQANGEVGRLGVAVDTVDDMLDLFQGIDLAEVSVSMTINAPAPIVMAYFLVVAEEQGVPFEKLRGTIQNDMLKEFHAQNEFVFPPEPSIEMVVDVIEYCTLHVPQFNPVSISGYHIREAGSTAGQELAFTLADGLEYVRRGVARGLNVDAFAPRLSFFFNAHNDFLEEIAKYRSARRIWATQMESAFGAVDPRSRRMRFHAQTAGCSLQAPQPQVNLVRVAFQAMAAVLGGCQSLHTNSMDETLSLPTEDAVTLALRTQQVLAYETGVANTVDPFGGSYCIEALTDELECEAEQIFSQIEETGGMVAAIEDDYFRRLIGNAAARHQAEVDRGERIVVGVNAFTDTSDSSIELHAVDPKVEQRQKDRLASVRSSRNAEAADAAREKLHHAAAAGENVMPALLAAARARVSVGEVMATLESVHGRYRPPSQW